jgi:hypothetical protein
MPLPGAIALAVDADRDSHLSYLLRIVQKISNFVNSHQGISEKIQGKAKEHYV